MPEMWDIVDQNGNKTGRLHERGRPMQKGEYHLSVSVWILNRQGEFLISKRAPAKTAPGMWETTGGGAIAGEDGLEAAVREVREELGIALRPENGRVFTRYTFPHSGGDGAAFIEVWVFAHECALSSVRLQSEETCDAMWASPAVIKRMIREGRFTAYSYMEELLDAASAWREP